MQESLLRLGTAAAGVAALAAVAVLTFDILFRERWRLDARVRQEFRNSRGGDKQSLFRGLEELTLGVSDPERLDLQGRLELLIAQSGLTISLWQLALHAAICGALGLILGLAFAPHWGLALPLSLSMACLPLLWLEFWRRRRYRRLLRQLPEAFDLMSRAVRAGQSLPGAMRLAATECSQPAAGEFGLVCDQQNLGLPFDVTLRDLARRNDIMEFRLFVVGMLVQRQSGGNPIDLLEHLAARIRKRGRLRDRVRALTSEGRMQAWVLGILPIAALAAITVIDAEYASALWNRPQLLLALAAAQVTGALWIRNIVNFEF